VQQKKSGGVVGEEGECGDNVVGLLERDTRRLDILSVKKTFLNESAELIVSLNSHPYIMRVAMNRCLSPN